ncbi:MAG: hypothetical protein L3J07_03725 [Candidatus Magasanikbacteria bacterium]|nr:hypothetical protein [Candidatus Magasanikbacteria bacterium]
MEVQKSKIIPRDKRMADFTKQYGTLGKVILNAFKTNHAVPSNFRGYTQDYYITLAKNFLRRFQSECARMVFMAMVEKKLTPKDTKAIAENIIQSLCEPF